MGMQRYFSHFLMVFAVITLMNACNCEKVDDPNTGEPAVSFQLSRSGESENQLIRVLIAERSADNTTATDGGLYCAFDKRYFLASDATTFLAEKLKLQWYKFVFMGVPDIEGKIEGEKLFLDVSAEAGSEVATTKDFSKLLVDYTSVLGLQAKEQDAASTYDLNLYRGVANCWMTRPSEAGDIPEETVVMKRITGEFKLDMGVLQDQFEHTVSDIVLSLKVPNRVYVYDNYREYVNNDDEDSESDVYVDGNYTMEYKYNVSSDLAQSETEHCEIILDLLPCTLVATLQINFVQPESGSIEPQRYEIHSDEASSLVEIKPNVRTTLLFNGMHKGEFEVRYAGFDGSSIDVAEDDWNGWGNNTDGGQ
jgi:hypothetical protein